MTSGTAGVAVGVDAGGSGSRAVVVRDGVVVARRDLGPINVLLHPDAVDRLAAAVTDAGAVAAGFGLAGLRSAEHARELTAELARRTGATVAVGDDTEAALAGAFAGRPGIVVIAGTGSGAAGRDAAGRTVRVGGHGFLLGDEGGAYWIGIQAIRAALRGADGSGPATTLSAAVPRSLARASIRDVADAATGQALDRIAIGRLAPIVVAAADGGDPAAAAIVEDAAGHLAQLVASVAAAAPFLDDDERIVVGAGGVLAAGGRVARALAARLAADAPGLALILPEVPPVIGALSLALRRGAVPIDATVRRRLAEQVPALGIATKDPSGAPA